MSMRVKKGVKRLLAYVCAVVLLFITVSEPLLAATVTMTENSEGTLQDRGTIEVNGFAVAENGYQLQGSIDITEAAVTAWGDFAATGMVLMCLEVTSVDTNPETGEKYYENLYPIRLFSTKSEAIVSITSLENCLIEENEYYSVSPCSFRIILKDESGRCIKGDTLKDDEEAEIQHSFENCLPAENGINEIWTDYRSANNSSELVFSAGYRGIVDANSSITVYRRELFNTSEAYTNLGQITYSRGQAFFTACNADNAEDFEAGLFDWGNLYFKDKQEKNLTDWYDYAFVVENSDQMGKSQVFKCLTQPFAEAPRVAEIHMNLDGELDIELEDSITEGKTALGFDTLCVALYTWGDGFYVETNEVMVPLSNIVEGKISVLPTYKYYDNELINMSKGFVAGLDYEVSVSFWNRHSTIWGDIEGPYQYSVEYKDDGVSCNGFDFSLGDKSITTSEDGCFQADITDFVLSEEDASAGYDTLLLRCEYNYDSNEQRYIDCVTWPIDSLNNIQDKINSDGIYPVEVPLAEVQPNETFHWSLVLDKAIDGVGSPQVKIWRPENSEFPYVRSNKILTMNKATLSKQDGRRLVYQNQSEKGKVILSIDTECVDMEYLSNGGNVSVSRRPLDTLGEFEEVSCTPLSESWDAWVCLHDSSAEIDENRNTVFEYEVSVITERGLRTARVWAGAFLISAAWPENYYLLTEEEGAVILRLDSEYADSLKEYDNLTVEYDGSNRWIDKNIHGSVMLEKRREGETEFYEVIKNNDWENRTTIAVNEFWEDPVITINNGWCWNQEMGREDIVSLWPGLTLNVRARGERYVRQFRESRESYCQATVNLEKTITLSGVEEGAFSPTVTNFTVDKNKVSCYVTGIPAGWTGLAMTQYTRNQYGIDRLTATTVVSLPVDYTSSTIFNVEACLNANSGETVYVGFEAIKQQINQETGEPEGSTRLESDYEREVTLEAGVADGMGVERLDEQYYYVPAEMNFRDADNQPVSIAVGNTYGKINAFRPEPAEDNVIYWHLESVKRKIVKTNTGVWNFDSAWTNIPLVSNESFWYREDSYGIEFRDSGTTGVNAGENTYYRYLFCISDGDGNERYLYADLSPVMEEADDVGFKAATVEADVTAYDTDESIGIQMQISDYDKYSEIQASIDGQNNVGVSQQNTLSVSKEYRWFMNHDFTITRIRSDCSNEYYGPFELGGEMEDATYLGDTWNGEYSVFTARTSGSDTSDNLMSGTQYNVSIAAKTEIYDMANGFSCEQSYLPKRYQVTTLGESNEVSPFTVFDITNKYNVFEFRLRYSEPLTDSYQLYLQYKGDKADNQGEFEGTIYLGRYSQYSANDGLFEAPLIMNQGDTVTEWSLYSVSETEGTVSIYTPGLNDGFRTFTLIGSTYSLKVWDQNNSYDPYSYIDADYSVPAGKVGFRFYVPPGFSLGPIVRRCMSTGNSITLESGMVTLTQDGEWITVIDNVATDSEEQYVYDIKICQVDLESLRVFRYIGTVNCAALTEGESGDYSISSRLKDGKSVIDFHYEDADSMTNRSQVLLELNAFDDEFNEHYNTFCFFNDRDFVQKETVLERLDEGNELQPGLTYEVSVSNCEIITVADDVICLSQEIRKISSRSITNVTTAGSRIHPAVVDYLNELSQPVEGIKWNANMAEFRISDLTREYDYIYFEYDTEEGDNRRILLADLKTNQFDADTVMEVKLPLMLSNGTELGCRLVLIREENEEERVENYVYFPGTRSEITVGTAHTITDMDELNRYLHTNYITGQTHVNAEAGDFIVRIATPDGQIGASYRAWIKENGGTDAYTKAEVKVTEQDEIDTTLLVDEVQTNLSKIYDLVIEVMGASGFPYYLYLCTKPIQRAPVGAEIVEAGIGKYTVSFERASLEASGDVDVMVDYSAENTYTHVCDSDHYTDTAHNVASNNNRLGLWDTKSGITYYADVYTNYTYATPDPYDGENMDITQTAFAHLEKTAEGEQEGINPLTVKVESGNAGNVLSIVPENPFPTGTIISASIKLCYEQDSEWKEVEYYRSETATQAKELLNQEVLPIQIVVPLASDTPFYVKVVIKKEDDDKEYSAVSLITTLSLVANENVDGGVIDFNWQQAEQMKPVYTMMNNSTVTGKSVWRLAVLDGYEWDSKALVQISNRNSVLNQGAEQISTVNSGGDIYTVTPSDAAVPFDYVFVVKNGNKSYAYLMHSFGCSNVLSDDDTVGLSVINKNQLVLNFSAFTLGTAQNPKYDNLSVEVTARNPKTGSNEYQRESYSSDEIGELPKGKLTITSLKNSQGVKEALYYDTTYTVTVYATGKGATGSSLVYTAGYVPRVFTIKTKPERVAQILTIQKPGTQEAVSTLTAAFGSEAIDFSQYVVHTVGDGAVTYASDKTSVAKVSSAGMITIIGMGTAKITVKAAQNADYLEAVKSVTVTVGAGTPAFQGTTSYTKYEGNEPFTLDVKLTKGDGKLTYQSDNTAVATVDASGKVTIKAKGKAVITVTAAATKKYLTSTKKVTVTVAAGKPVTGVTLTGTRTETSIGSSFTVTAAVVPNNTTYAKGVKWASSNAAVATVDQSGMVTAVAAGTAEIKAISTSNTKVIGKFTLKVAANAMPFTSVSIMEDKLLPNLNDVLQLSVATEGSANQSDSVTWSSNNTAILTIDAGGKMKAVGYGSATITAQSTLDGSIKDTCLVLVANTSDAGSFVERMYVFVMSRESEKEGSAYWTKCLKNGTITGAQIAQNFVMSEEFIAKNYSDDEFLTIMYQSFFGRLPDSEGYQFWKNKLDNGASRKYVLSQFIIADEYKRVCGIYGIQMGEYVSDEARDANPMLTEYLCRCYTKALGRPFDVSGTNYWADLILNKGVSAKRVAIEFIQSPEFVEKNLSDEEYVKVLYRTFFGREFDNEGFTYWMTNLSSGADNRESVLQFFADSTEFRTIMNSYGVN